MENVNIIIKEDDSVELLLNDVADKLKGKYDKRRKVNLKYLNRTWWQKLLSGLLTFVLIFAIVVCVVFTISIFHNKRHGTPVSLFGYSLMTVPSPSMTASGIEKNSNILVRAVDSSTLHIGDYIAFYNYPGYNDRLAYLEYEPYTQTAPKTEYDKSFKRYLGILSPYCEEAGESGAIMVIHEIIRMYIDENGELWFKTKGTSNESEDLYFVSQKMVVGIYQDSSLADLTTIILRAMQSNQAMVILSILPLVFCGFLLLREVWKKLQLTKLELDCVEEKRKITDEICVKNEIGFNMDEKTKLKVLAQADFNEKYDYMNLLWKKDKLPDSVRKFILSRDLLLRHNKKLLDLNRRCEQMFKDGVEPKKIAKIYLAEKAEIKQEEAEYGLKLEEIKKKYHDEEVKQNKIVRKRNKSADKMKADLRTLPKEKNRIIVETNEKDLCDQPKKSNKLANKTKEINKQDKSKNEKSKKNMIAKDKKKTSKKAKDKTNKTENSTVKKDEKKTVKENSKNAKK